MHIRQMYTVNPGIEEFNQIPGIEIPVLKNPAYNMHIGEMYIVNPGIEEFSNISGIEICGIEAIPGIVDPGIEANPGIEIPVLKDPGYNMHIEKCILKEIVY